MKLKIIFIYMVSMLFLEAATLETNKESYTSEEKIEVLFSEMSGDNHDWIAVYPKGSSNDWENVIDWRWTDGQVDGSFTLKTLDSGEYEVRAFFKNSYLLESDYSFSVGLVDTTIVLTTDKKVYKMDESIKIHFENMSNNNKNWIAIYPKGTSTKWENMLLWNWTDGLINGEIIFDGLKIGEYEVRAFYNNSYTVEAINSFEVKEEFNDVKTSLKIGKDRYSSSEKIVVTFKNMSKSQKDWIAIYPKGASTEWEYVQDWKWINGEINGEVTFNSLDAGEYEVRAFFNNTYTVEAREYFTVTEKKNYLFKSIIDSSQAYYGDWLSDKLFVINLDKMSLEKTLHGGIGSYGLESIGNNLLISLTRKDTSIDIVDVRSKEIIRTIELGYQPREVSSSPDEKYSVVSGRDIPAHTLFNAKTGKVIQHFNRDLQKVNITDFGGQNATGHPFFINNQQYLILDRVHRNIYLYHVTEGLQNTLKTETTMHHILSKGNSLYISLEGSGSTIGERIAPAILKIMVVDNKILSLGTAFLDNSINAGVHHFNFHYDGEHIYVGSNDGYVYVVNSTSMEVVDKIKSGFGGGHVDFSKKYERAMISNHKSNFLTLVNVQNPSDNKIIKKRIKIAKQIDGVTMQGHTQIISDDELFFYGAATNDGNFFKVNMLTGKVEKKLYLGEVHLEQGFMYQSPEGAFTKVTKKFSKNSYLLATSDEDKILTNRLDGVKNKVVLSSWTEEKNEAWDIEMRFDNYFNLKNRYSGKCLTVNKQKVMVETCINVKPRQLWEAIVIEENKVNLINKLTNKCLESDNGENVLLNSCNNSSTQLWKLSSLL